MGLLPSASFRASTELDLWCAPEKRVTVRSLSWLTWGSLAYTTVIGFIVSNILWIRALRTSGPNRSSLWANLQVFGGAAVGVLLLGESLGRLQIAGGAVIAAGIALTATRLKLKRGAPALE